VPTIYGYIAVLTRRDLARYSGGIPGLCALDWVDKTTRRPHRLLKGTDRGAQVGHKPEKQDGARPMLSSRAYFNTSGFRGLSLALKASVNKLGADLKTSQHPKLGPPLLEQRRGVISYPYN